jgi:hypothetical protein
MRSLQDRKWIVEASNSMNVSQPTSLPAPPSPTANSADDIPVNSEQVAQSKEEWLVRRRAYRRLVWKRRASRVRSALRQLQWFLVTRIERIHNVIRRDSRTTSDKLLVSVAFGLFTGCILLAIYLFCTRIMTSAGLLLGLTAVLGSLYAVFFVSDRSIKMNIAACRNDLDELRRYFRESGPVLQQARSALIESRKKYNELRNEFRRMQMLSTEPPAQREVPFEIFLKDAFIALGYRVDLTKIPGDQRIDLIIEKDSVRTAIQAKENVETVGKNAVQQAYAGMKFHACDRCAIVTNSSFSLTAIELAKTVGCVLINGSQISDLVAGRIDLGKALDHQSLDRTRENST